MRLFALATLFAVPAIAQPRVTAVVNAGSFEPAIARGGLVTIFGTGLSQSTVNATSVPLPKRLANTVVTVGELELEAPLYSVSPTQINAQIPFEILGNRAALTVSTPAGKSQPLVLTLLSAAPGIFTRSSNGKGPAIAFNSRFEQIESLIAGEPLILYATGLGPTDPPVLSGMPGLSAEPLNRVVQLPEVTIGESPAQVVFAGLAPGLPGVYQLNVIPQRPASDRLSIRSTEGRSHLVEIALQPGQNVSNASGSIEVLYPTPDAPPATVSTLLVAAKITARMDIAPSAGSFAIAAVSEAGASLINVDPVNGRFEGSATLPTRASRFGDFSGSELRPLDLITCRSESDTIVCDPSPGAIIPASRIWLGERNALDSLPLPNTNIPNRATGLLVTRGIVAPGSTFVIDDTNNSALSVFAGYISIPVPPVSNRSTTLKLFIDGRLVASRELVYKVETFGR